MRKTLVVLGILLITILFILGACGPETAMTPSEEEEKDYLSALDGIDVITTLYHDEVMPPPPGSKYPPTFYEPMLVGTVPPNVAGSVTLQPYGQPYDTVEIEPDWFSEGQTLDFLFEADKPVLWQEDEPDTVAVYAEFGWDVDAKRIGLLNYWGFFYEGAMTEIQAEGDTTQRRYSTALRVIAWEDEYLELSFRNFSSEVAEVSYSIWRGDFVPNFIDDYVGAWGQYLESSEFSEEEFLEMKWDMEEYLRERWQ